jgi:hypothetical protein
VVAGLMLTACGQGGPPTVEYRLLSHEAEIGAARLMLCDQSYEMERQGQVWAVRVPVTCEGGGMILVRLADGASVSCSGDFVEPRMQPTTYGYIASSTGCAFAH